MFFAVFHRFLPESFKKSAFWGSLDLEQKPSADNQVKRICACTSERTKIAIRQLTSGEFMQSIKDEIFVSN